MAREFTCAGCNGTFTASNTVDEMISERETLYADEPLADGDEFLSVCDACHRKTLMRIAAQPTRKAAPVAFKLLRATQ